MTRQLKELTKKLDSCFEEGYYPIETKEDEIEDLITEIQSIYRRKGPLSWEHFIGLRNYRTEKY